MLTLPREERVFEYGFMPGQTVADFGAGSGHVALALARALGDDGRVIAIDLREEPLVLLKNQSLEEDMDNVEIIMGDVEKFEGTGLKEALVDGVVMSHILAQLTSKKGAVQEAHRILKRKGRVCVVEAEDNISQEEMKELFEKNGFAFERRFEADGRDYGMSFKKV